MSKRVSCGITLLSLVLFIGGCGGPEAVNVRENADQQAIDDYKKLVAAEEAANAGSEGKEAPRPE
ncbi:hypothetical protein [Stieleria mannarensis]|uniref:hypothetical protein n=1 Tax=Stieleria mannarensis TaxID=2755585 RepID=UPI0015FFB367|nr:hypothetical protein [Rhodopirellula sp. JC639]